MHHQAKPTTNYWQTTIIALIFNILYRGLSLIPCHCILAIVNLIVKSSIVGIPSGILHIEKCVVRRFSRCLLQGIEYSPNIFGGDIEPALLPQILSLIANKHGKSSLYLHFSLQLQRLTSTLFYFYWQKGTDTLFNSWKQGGYYLSYFQSRWFETRCRSFQTPGRCSKSSSCGSIPRSIWSYCKEWRNE